MCCVDCPPWRRCLAQTILYIRSTTSFEMRKFIHRSHSRLPKSDSLPDHYSSFNPYGQDNHTRSRTTSRKSQRFNDSTNRRIFHSTRYTMRLPIILNIATITFISAIPMKRQTCTFPSSGCDITLEPNQSACCGDSSALHCYSDGTSSIQDCGILATCLLFSSGDIHDCRCGTAGKM